METTQQKEEKKSSDQSQQQQQKVIPNFFEKFPEEAQLFAPDKTSSINNKHSISFYSHVKVLECCSEEQKQFCQQTGVDPRICSNLWECSFIIDNTEYQSTEHYFQMYKYDEGCKNFMALLSSRDVAAFGQRRLTIKQIHLDIIDKLKEDGQKFPQHQEGKEFKLEDVPKPSLQIQNWDDAKIKVMYDALEAKFTQNDELKQQLLNSQNTWIIEHTKNDFQWGDGDLGEGSNFLGKLLMYLREQLRGKTIKINPEFLKAPQNTLIQY